MTNHATGHAAEKTAALYLQKQGYKIRDLNWRTRYCEIDIVAEKRRKIYFVEVKYRKSTDFGSGLEYITRKKLQQMQFAAEMWIHQQRWQNDYQLAALGIDGEMFSFVLVD